MREIHQTLQDGSLNYGQGVIGPSAQDILLFNSRTVPSLRNFPGISASDTAPIVLAGSALALAGCVTIVPPENSRTSESTDGRAGAPEISEEFIAFLEKNDRQRLDAGVAQSWIESLGIPADFYESIYNHENYPFYIFENPDQFWGLIETFEVFPKTETNAPEAGDIILGFPTNINPVRTWVALDAFKASDDGTRTTQGIPGESTDLGDLRIINMDDVVGWIRPKIQPEGAGDSGEEILIARTESLQDLLNRFIDKYSGKPVEKNDPNNLNQCMDLIVAWADELGIPRDAVTGMLYAKNLFLNPKEATSEYFEIIPYEEGSQPKLGDVVVWDEGIGDVAGHAAISIGDSDPSENWMQVFSQNYPTGRWSQIEPIGFDHILGYLRPKGFGKGGQEQPLTEDLSREFVPSNPEEFARYQIAGEIVDFLDGRIYSYGDRYYHSTGLNESEREIIRRKLTRGEPIEEITVKQVMIDDLYIESGDIDADLYLYQEGGDIYEVPMEMGISKIRDLRIDLETYGDEVRNGYRLAFGGRVYITGKYSYDFVTITIRDTLENLEFLADGGDLNHEAFSRLTSFSNWVENTRRIPNVFVRENGDIECEGYNELVINFLPGCGAEDRSIVNFFRMWGDGDEGPDTTS